MNEKLFAVVERDDYGREIIKSGIYASINRDDCIKHINHSIALKINTCYLDCPILQTVAEMFRDTQDDFEDVSLTSYFLLHRKEITSWVENGGLEEDDWKEYYTIIKIELDGLISAIAERRVI